MLDNSRTDSATIRSLPKFGLQAVTEEESSKYPLCPAATPTTPTDARAS